MDQPIGLRVSLVGEANVVGRSRQNSSYLPIHIARCHLQQHHQRVTSFPSGEQAQHDFTMLAPSEMRGLDPCEALFSAGGDRLLRRSEIGPAVRQYHDA